MNEPKENENYSDVMSIHQYYFLLKKDIELIEKDYGKYQWRSIYEVIHEHLF